MNKPADSFAVGAIDFTGGSLGKLFISKHIEISHEFIDSNKLMKC